uniref:Uncharacterized protein n=1 Tax=Arundo donax TaxID=35708 RepID=A0A0A9HVV0_ARUDO
MVPLAVPFHQAIQWHHQVSQLCRCHRLTKYK